MTCWNAAFVEGAMVEAVSFVQLEYMIELNVLEGLTGVNELMSAIAGTTLALEGPTKLAFDSDVFSRLATIKVEKHASASFVVAVLTVTP